MLKPGVRITGMRPESLFAIVAAVATGLLTFRGGRAERLAVQEVAP